MEPAAIKFDKAASGEAGHSGRRLGDVLVISTADMARIMNISSQTVARLARQGLFKSTVFAGRRYFPKTELKKVGIDPEAYSDYAL